MEKQQIKLGQKAKDKVTGFTGILTGHADYLTGCDQYLIQPTVKKEGDYRDGHWFDEGKIEVLGEALTEKDVQADDNGCDQTAPIG